MKTKLLISAVLFSAAVASPAWAATVTGRITYLDANAHRLMLDSSEMYSVAPDLTSEGLEVGRLITADVTTHDNEKVITKVLKFT